MDELLPPAVTGDVTGHLDSCAECRDFRDDLRLGRRAILATTPELPENFEWKLQLKLNQALQQAAGESVLPWVETDPDKGRWLRNFGAAAAVGMAAVLALAMFLGPVGGPVDDGSSRLDGGSPALVQSPLKVPAGADRLPLIGGRAKGGGLYSTGIQRSVSAGGTSRSSSPIFDRGWSGHDVEDLRTIQRLRLQNSHLSRLLTLQQQQISGMRALLDTTDVNALNLEEE
jgi:hypothetical protein